MNYTRFYKYSSNFSKGFLIFILSANYLDGFVLFSVLVLIIHVYVHFRNKYKEKGFTFLTTSYLQKRAALSQCIFRSLQCEDVNRQEQNETCLERKTYNIT